MTRARHLPLPAVLLAATLAGCTPDQTPVASTTATAGTVTGTLILNDAFDWTRADGCYGTGDNADIRAGSPVTITDAASATISRSTLTAGTLQTMPGPNPSDGCKFTFTAADVPTGRGPYGVAVARRAVVEYPERELFGPLALSLR